DVRLAREIEVPAARLGLDLEGILEVPVRLAAPVEVGHWPLLRTIASGVGANLSEALQALCTRSRSVSANRPSRTPRRRRAPRHEPRRKPDRCPRDPRRDRPRHDPLPDRRPPHLAGGFCPCNDGRAGKRRSTRSARAPPGSRRPSSRAWAAPSARRTPHLRVEGSPQIRRRSPLGVTSLTASRDAPRGLPG